MGTAATTVAGVLAGAAVIRVHDVRPNWETLLVARAILEVAEDADAGADLRVDETARGRAKEGYA